MSSAALVYSTPAERGRRIENEFAAAVLTGLRHHQKELPCKFFYDEEGSRLFAIAGEAYAAFFNPAGMRNRDMHGADWFFFRPAARPRNTGDP